jgi:dihydroorotate dehydrogenase
MMYRVLIRPWLFLCPAETAHNLVMWGCRLVHRHRVLQRITRWLFEVRDPRLHMPWFGRTLPNPVGLAAGLDKNAEAFRAFDALGFGLVEVGTLTAVAQPGNPKPRLFRLVRDRAIVNRMGFNNRGVLDAVPRLAELRSTDAQPPAVTLGVNIGKSRVVDAEDAKGAERDYVASADAVLPYADYLVVNVSSPNTPGLRDLQQVDRLRPLLSALARLCAGSAATRAVPLFVKIAPDLADDDVDAIADLAVEVGLSGVIAANTTLARQGLRTDPEAVGRIGAGGLSGPVLRDRSLALLRRLRRRVGDRLVLVSVGGVQTADDVWERIAHGATVVQVYTALVYDGPSLVKTILRGLRKKLDRSPYRSLHELRGTSV